MIDECPMTEDCPGYDRDRRMCLIRPDDCEFSPAHGESDLTFETPEVPSPEVPMPSASAVAGSR